MKQGGLTVDRFLMVYDLRMMRAVSPIPLLLDPLLLRFMPSFSSRIAVASSLGQLQLVDTVTLSEPDLTVYQGNDVSFMAKYTRVSDVVSTLLQHQSGNTVLACLSVNLCGYIAKGSTGLIHWCKSLTLLVSEHDTKMFVRKMPEVSLQVNTGNSLSLALDVSTSCQALALGDSGGSIHLFTSQNNAIFNAFSRPTEFADPIEPFDSISITDSLAILSSVPLVYTSPPTTMLSDWPKKFLKNVCRPTPPIDPEILRTMKMQGTIGYAPNPNTKLRNQVPYIMNSRSTAQEQRKNEENSTTFAVIPKRYRKLDLKYSKSGLDDLDMDQYNKTPFSGLEATLPNSYCNAMIQVLYFLEPLRHVVLSHLCHSEFCLCCELAFLFRMLDVSRGQPCHAGNFLRALRNAHEASALGLILPDQNNPNLRKKTNLISLIQNWNRFILHQIHFELLEETKRREKENLKAPPFVYRDTDFPSIDLPRQKRKTRPDISEETPVSSNIESKDEETEISRMFGTKQIHVHRCLKCQREVSKESSLLVCNLIYPENGEW
ncbi:poly(A)-specific ribonuclease [Homalodisca vitripennis]|nr:poly(A)-specific ribonuclease [Homalodisca vitripennis]